MCPLELHWLTPPGSAATGRDCDRSPASSDALTSASLWNHALIGRLQRRTARPHVNVSLFDRLGIL